MSKAVFPSLLKVVKHLTVKLLETPSTVEEIKFLACNIDNFNFVGEHLTKAQGALMVPPAVVGNHWSKAMSPWRAPWLSERHFWVKVENSMSIIWLKITFVAQKVVIYNKSLFSLKSKNNLKSVNLGKFGFLQFVLMLRNSVRFSLVPEYNVESLMSIQFS